MFVTVHFYSYFKEIAGCAETIEDLPDGSSLGELTNRLFQRFPKLGGMRRSTLTAVGVEYQGPDYVLKAGDEVSLFPPVQGG
jgi:molybdopterin converting factor small subunit